MKHNRKTAFLFFLLAGAVLITSLFFLFFGLPWTLPNEAAEIKSLTPELIEKTENRFQVEIPDDAVLLKGNHYVNMRDSWLVVLLECPCDPSETHEPEEIYPLLRIQSENYGIWHKDEAMLVDWYEKMGGNMDWCIEKKNESDQTFISYSFQKDRALIRLVAYRP